MTSNHDMKFMRLFLLSQDVCPSVIRKLVSLKLLTGYNDNIVEFLNSDDGKRTCYHKWKKNGQCCLCPTQGCKTSKKPYKIGINNQMFYTLYDVDMIKQLPGHHKKSGDVYITQFCIHTLIAKNGITLGDFDLYMLLCLLEPCMASLSQQQQTDLEILKSIRNDICHCNPSDLSETVIEAKRFDLETAILNLDNSDDTKGAIHNLELNQFTFTESEVDRWLTQNENIYRDENDVGSDSTCTNLSRLKWFAHFCRASAKEQYEVDLSTSWMDLAQTASSSVFCRIEVKNSTSSILDTPNCTVDKGFISNPPKLVLSSWGKCFLLTHNSLLSGTRGVVSWKIKKKDFRAAIMWSIPYSYKSGKRNTLSIGFIDRHEADIFDIMNQPNQPNSNEETHIRLAIYDRECNLVSCVKQNLKLVGIMTNGYKAVISIEIKER